jgi:dTDP-4-amino-4,6-dideoxygalactose transaminase
VREEFLRGWPSFSDEEVAAVERVLRSGRVNYWTGDETRRFEQAFSDFVGVEHAVALANGTVALELALRSLGVGKGDDVVVTSRSFVASASAVAVLGATPVFADVDPDSQNVTAETIERALTPSTRAVVVVHLGGWPCDMVPIMELAESRGLLVVEDCAQALGAAYRGSSVGCFGHAAAWSFCQDKIMTTGGEGGMMTTSDSTLFEKAWSYKDHGKNRAALMSSQPGPGFKWVHDSIGTNWRMTEMQSAIGNVNLPKVQGWVQRRRELAGVLDDHFSSDPHFRTTVPAADFYHAYYKYYVFLEPRRFTDGRSRNDLLEDLYRREVPAFHGICAEIYLEGAFEDGFAPDERHPVASRLAETAIMIPIHPNLSDESVREVGQVISEVARGV